MSEYTRDLFVANGELLPVAAFDDLFQPQHHYIYEVFRIIEGIPLFIDDHLDRFYQTTRLAGAVAGCDREHLLADIHALISANGGNEGNIKISIVPGKTGANNLLIYFTPHLYPTAAQFDNGVTVRLLDAERKNPNAKVMDIPLRAETDQIKHTDEVYEVLLVDRNGFITEGSRSNVFFIKGQEVITPPLDSVLPGVTRKQILNICIENGIPVSEQKVHTNRLGQIDALFISGTSRKVLPVCRIGDKSFPVNNLLLKRVSDLFNQHVQNYLKLHRKSDNKL